ncbi:hypothetical protein EG328_001075 [Venturia inaequalis]|uniref:Uncharacterized protein n=1 Tax=Venturia inaequalis TaxID=5025 RepID=A0A8H3YZ33_VENIN|nr:hypothetical protein EG328_001075 [Venturia inaequalis]
MAMRSYLCLAAWLSTASVTASPLYLGKNGPVVKAEAGTAGMDPAIFRPLQARGQTSDERTAAVGQLTQIDSPVQRRQEKRRVDDVVLPFKRQAPKVTVTTTTTIPPAADVQTVTATVTATANAMAAAAQATQPGTGADASKPSASAEASKPSADAAASKTSADTAASQTSADTSSPQTSADPAASQTSADTSSPQTSADPAASQTSADTSSPQTSADAAASQAAQAAQASTSADTSSSTTSSDQAKATMNANANSNSTESSPSSTPNPAASAIAAADNGRTTFDNSQGVEIQAGAIQAAKPSSSTQTDLLPSDEASNSTTPAASPQQPVPDAADGGPLPQPTGPPNNGIGADAAGQPPQPSGPDAASPQTPQISADPPVGQSQPPADGVAPPFPPDTAPPTGALQGPPDPNSSTPSPPDNNAAGTSNQQKREVEHQYRKAGRVLHERLIRRSGTLPHFQRR